MMVTTHLYKCRYRYQLNVLPFKFRDLFFEYIYSHGMRVTYPYCRPVISAYEDKLSKLGGNILVGGFVVQENVS